jgi:hypothetical protein
MRSGGFVAALNRLRYRRRPIRARRLRNYEAAYERAIAATLEGNED